MINFKEWMLKEDLSQNDIEALVMRALKLDIEDADAKQQKLSLFDNRKAILDMPIIKNLPNFPAISAMVNVNFKSYTVGSLIDSITKAAQVVPGEET